MEIEGKIIQVLNPQTGIDKNGNAWKVQSYILETIETYPRKVCIEVFGIERCEKVKAELNQLVKVSYDLESREFNGRWYTSVRAWKIEEATPAAQPVEKKADPAPQVPGAENASTQLSF